MSRKITYLPSRWERPSPRTRPSCTATTEAFGALISSTNCGAASAFSAPLAAPDPAAVGDGAGTEPGTDPAAVVVESLCAVEPAAGAPVSLDPVSGLPATTALAFAVALDGDAEAGAGSSAPQEICLPVTGRRASTRPVSVAITDLG